MSQHVAVAVRQAGIRAIAVNDTFRLVSWADMLVAGDCGWWLKRADAALNFPGTKVTSSSNVPFRSVMHLRPSGSSGFDPNCSNVRTGGNSGYQAVHIAMQAGAKKIILCGIDLSLKNGVHWHGPHGDMSNPTDALILRMREKFESLIIPAKNLGIEIINCSPSSELDCFPKLPLDEVLHGEM